MEIGIDCVDICRFEGIEANKKLLEKIFTKNEIEYCMSRTPHAQHFAVRFAAKEAVTKALAGYGITIALNQIEISRDEHGRPSVQLLNRHNSGFVIKISLTHSHDVAIANVLIGMIENKAE